MTHVHEYKSILLTVSDATEEDMALDLGMAECAHCGERLSGRSILGRLNATEELSGEDAMSAQAMYIPGSSPYAGKMRAYAAALEQRG